MAECLNCKHAKPCVIDPKGMDIWTGEVRCELKNHFPSTIDYGFVTAPSSNGPLYGYISKMENNNEIILPCTDFVSGTPQIDIGSIEETGDSGIRKGWK